MILASSIRKIELINNTRNRRVKRKDLSDVEIRLKKYQEKKYGMIFK
jgi:hypothetical protein